MDIPIDESLIRQVARNANLDLSEAEVKQFEQDFKDVLSYFEILEKAPVADKPSFHPVKLDEKMREDIPKQGITQAEAIKNVKSKSDGFIRGPKII